jgi:hypothetical protein
MIVLKTPTGGREKQIQLCAKWMHNQTYTENVTWIIVDDCVPRTTDFIDANFKANWTIKKVYPAPIWEQGQNTQSRNIQFGISQITDWEDVSAVFIIEDDDYYSSRYLSIMTLMLANYDLCGEKNTMYYNINVRSGRYCQNMKHSSLFQIAFKPHILPLFQKILEKNLKFIDIQLCRSVVNINLFEGLNLSIGIKGMKGREGIGMGHSIDNYPERIRKQSETLKNLIGEDAKYYENL